MRVLLADHFEAFRKGVVSVLSRSSGVLVSADVADADSAAVLAEILQPHVCILAADLPGVARAARRIKATDPQARIILLVEVPDDVQKFQTLGVPIDGYLPRATGVSELLEVLRPALTQN